MRKSFKEGERVLICLEVFVLELTRTTITTATRTSRNKRFNEQKCYGCAYLGTFVSRPAASAIHIICDTNLDKLPRRPVGLQVPGHIRTINETNGTCPLNRKLENQK